MTEFISLLLQSLEGETWPEETLLSSLTAISRVLLRERNLLAAPPCYLSERFIAFENWGMPGALRELAIDLFIYALRPTNAAQCILDCAQQGKEVEGLVFRRLRQQLFSWQRERDPVGYAVFKNVEAALQEALTDGELYLVGLVHGKTRNQTRCRFILPPGDQYSLVNSEKLRAILIDSSLWGSLISSMTIFGVTAQRELRKAFRHLLANGITGFRCGELINALKHDVRASVGLQHAADNNLDYHLNQHDQCSLPNGWSILEIIQFRSYAESIPKAIETLPLRDEQRRQRLQVIFSWLVRQSASDEPLSQAELGRHLSIPKSTLADDFKLLREVIKKMDSNSFG